MKAVVIMLAATALVLMAVVVLLMGDSGGTATPTPSPTVGPGETKTVPDFISEVLNNPDKYSIGDVIQVAGIATGRTTSDLASTYVYLGPESEGFYVVVSVQKYSDQWDKLRMLREGERVTVRGKYLGLNKAEKRITLFGGELISKE